MRIPSTGQARGSLSRLTPRPVRERASDLSGFGAGDNPNSLAIGDLDGDGDLDMAVANRNSDNVSVLLNQGDGTFADDVAYDVGGVPWSVATGDLDGDGDIDLAVANAEVSGDSVSVLLNQGDGTFAGNVPYGAGYFPAFVTMGDLDGDGDLDLAVADAGFPKGPGTMVSVLLNDGDGTFVDDSLYRAGDFTVSLAIGDLDADGDLELAVANTLGRQRLGSAGRMHSVTALADAASVHGDELRIIGTR